jgi:hypothetical protein
MDKILSFFSLKVMGGVLAASLLANVFLFWGYTHQAEKKAECTQTVKVAEKVATDKKVVIEYRQKVLTNEKEQALKSKLTSLREQLLDLQSRPSNLPEPTNPAPGTPETNPAPELLLQDQLICTINTDVAEGWQDWWSGQVKIRKEETGNATDTSGNSVPSE